jgi:pimeloyl-ACP methyl ester carboxylesterase
MKLKPAVRRGSALLTLAIVAITSWVGLAGSAGAAPSGHEQQRPTIVLVHGAWADASSWNAVTQRLQRRGFTVLAPANPLRGVTSDASYLASVLDTVEGPVVLVGHSYGGMVITNAAGGAANVSALVYVAAFAPAAGDTVGGLGAMNPGSGLGPDTLLFRPTPGGLDVYIAPGVFRSVFAADLPPRIVDIMAAGQRPIDAGALGEPSGDPAWATIPSWYLVATYDHAIPPATQRFMAERAGAHTVEVATSHATMLVEPGAVTDLILDAVAATD